MPNGISRRRLLAAGSAAMAAGAGLIGKTAFHTVLEHDLMVRRAKLAQVGMLEIPSQRGSLRDRSAAALATSVTTFRLMVDPAIVPKENVGTIANGLREAVGKPALEIAALISTPGSRRVVAEAIPFDRGVKLVGRLPDGFFLERMTRRTYPEGSLAPAVLGFVGRDGDGLTGLERDFDRELTGIPGRVAYEKDSHNREIPLSMRENVAAVDGADVVLTIDRFAQRIAEREADAAMARHKAAGVTIIVMAPFTGEVLAMTHRPVFNLTSPTLLHESNKPLYRNRPVTDLYEPGSIFKLITMAIALEEKIVSPSTTYQDDGYIQRYGRTIWNWDRTANGTTNMTKLLVKSANAGAVWLVDQIGHDRFYTYVRDFGFGNRTNIDIGGEATGHVRTNLEKEWSPFDLMTHSFGQALTATPLQLVSAICAIANGGVIMQPQVVKEIRSAQGSRTFRPVATRRVISAKTASTLSDMMLDVVTEGATKAIVDGYRTAGKSGTTQITQNGVYSEDQTIASFVQFPRNNPPFLVFASVDQPKDVQWGGQVAGPIAKSITAQLLAYYRIPPDSLRRDV